MSNLLAMLGTAGSALKAYQQALDVVQNNITNSTTPGYAKQSLNVEALPFDTAAGLAGGVAARGLISGRDEYAEAEVRRQLQSLGSFEGQAQGASSIENLFDVSGSSGISADLDQLFQGFSAWSVSPNSQSARQTVIASADKLAGDVRAMASAAAKTADSVGTEIESTVDQINQLASTIQQYNVQRQRQGSSDPGLEANANAALEQLAELVDVSTLVQPDGTYTVVLSGGAPLVSGQQTYALSAGTAAASDGGLAPSTVLDWQGQDVTAQVTAGKLGGLLDVRNRMLPSLIGGGGQTGSLNQFAKGLADTVNGILTTGFVASGTGAAQGQPLFSYDTSDVTRASATFSLNPAITPDGLAAVDASGNANGNALQLASLANSTAAGGIDGSTFGQFFSQIAAAVGRESAAAQQGKTTQSQVVAQTRALRDQSSGVSLDEQAVVLLQYQRSYQAAARFLTTVNDITQETIDLIK